eukprot:GHVP01057308.1.p1 GENE.GHVP01057308.1~~GHVP01057308.1.p1  ORF type:complete len:103 (+),score=8.66 GHVP01057308.1:48-311(+)
MEFKILSDQLNSACQDIVIPQANGFTVQDELHQANSSEPEFRGFAFQDGEYYSSNGGKGSGRGSDRIDNRMEFIKSTIKLALEKPSE